MNQAVKALGLDVEHFVLHDFQRTAAHLQNLSAAETPTEAGIHENQAAQRWADFVDAQIGDSRRVSTKS